MRAYLIRFGGALAVALALMAAWPVVPSAQSTVVAQILNFWRVLSVGGTFSGETLEYATLAIQANGYQNFGHLRGSGGYGIRDSGGTVEFKNSGGSWAAASGGATPTATFLVKTATGAPVNAQIMAALGTGITINTTTTGVQSIYSGTSCTNQFPRALSALGAATCSKVALGSDVSGTLAGANFPALSGAITTPGGSLTTSLTATGVTAATYGSATAIPVLTVNAGGQITAASDVAPQLTLTSTYFSSLSGANLTAVPAASLTGSIAAARMPAFTGDMTTSAGAVATTVSKIGNVGITLGGAFSTVGANTLAITTTGNTALTFPTTGTLVSSTVTTLSSLVSVGTISTGVWQGTAVTAAYGGTGLTTGCSNGVLYWSAPWVCSASPILTSTGWTGTTILGGTGVAGTAATNTSLVKTVTGIADAVSTPIVTVTVPNSAEGATLHVRFVGSLGAGGAIGAYECSSVIEGNVAIARTAGVATVATASTAGLIANSCVAGAATITFAYTVSAIAGATGASQSFTLNATITKGSGSSANHQVLVYASILNAAATGVTIS